MSAQVIGYLGENGVRDVRIPIGHLLEKWQGLRPSLVMAPVGGSDDEAYPVQYTMDGTDLVWHVSDEDTAVAGTTKAAVRMVDDGGRVGMDEPFQVIISPNLSAGGEPPVVIKPWVDKLTTLVPRAEEAAERAENAAERAENAAQNWENGTASNSNKLGDKLPEYYLPAVNLFRNSDWREGYFIAQAGINSLHGSVTYLGDGWKNESRISASINANGIVLDSANQYDRIQQTVANLIPGKPYTVALKSTGNVLRRVAVLNTGISRLDAEATGRDDLLVVNFTAVDSAHAFLFYPGYEEGGGSARFEWPMLLPGTYTAATLPPYVPRPYAVELAECQRYLVPINNECIGSGNLNSAGTHAYVAIPLPTTMRVSPSITSNGTTVTVRTNSGQYISSDYAVHSVKGNSAVLRIAVSGLTGGELCTASVSDVNMFLCADL